MSTNPQNIKAIIFDFMGVLLFPKSTIKPNNVRDEIDQIIGQVTDDQKFKLETMKKYSFSETQFNNILLKIIDKYEAFDSLWKLLPNLRKKYKLAIINNGTGLTLPLLKKIHQIDSNFDLFISSAIEGLKKPDPKIFQLTCKRLGVNLKDCLFMDDNKDNVKSAEKIGMQVIHWKTRQIGFKQFKEFIKSNY